MSTSHWETDIRVLTKRAPGLSLPGSRCRRMGYVMTKSGRHVMNLKCHSTTNKDRLESSVAMLEWRHAVLMHAVQYESGMDVILRMDVQICPVLPYVTPARPPLTTRNLEDRPKQVGRFPQRKRDTKSSIERKDSWDDSDEWRTTAPKSYYCSSHYSSHWYSLPRTHLLGHSCDFLTSQDGEVFNC
jgi:hypothetical protein